MPPNIARRSAGTFIKCGLLTFCLVRSRNIAGSNLICLRIIRRIFPAKLFDIARKPWLFCVVLIGLRVSIRDSTVTLPVIYVPWISGKFLPHPTCQKAHARMRAGTRRCSDIWTFMAYSCVIIRFKLFATPAFRLINNQRLESAMRCEMLPPFLFSS